MQKCSSWSRAKPSPHAPTNTLAPKQRETQGNSPGSSRGGRRVKPKMGSPKKAEVARSTRRANATPSCVFLTGRSLKHRQFDESSSGSRRIALKPPLVSTAWSCKRSAKKRNSGASASATANGGSENSGAPTEHLPAWPRRWARAALSLVRVSSRAASISTLPTRQEMPSPMLRPTPRMKGWPPKARPLIMNKFMKTDPSFRQFGCMECTSEMSSRPSRRHMRQ
mmetsp:Transcript_32115/g.93822  ORF Transcript_32115/g.93822 Transcript_32115/m.93822 type:complete len:224 (-) Transcript_32115:415-1086(-)